MEVGSELLWKASSAILLCFLVARLVSLVLSFSVPPSTADQVKEKGSKRTATVDLDREHSGHKKHLKSPVHGGGGGERLSKIRGSGGKKKKRVKFVDQAAKVVDLQEFLVKEMEVKGFGGVGRGENEGIERRECGDVGENVVDQKEKEDRLVGFEEGEGISGNVKDGDEGMLSDEEEWEGIERSELEKEFGRARDFVECGEKEVRFAMVGSNVMMELYGLQKVAMEGPCHEPQPMALKLSARAKWNAWQRLGNMSPEEAMERYIALLSNSFPGWMDDHSSVETERFPKEEIHSLSDANPNTCLVHHSTSASERTTESSDLTDAPTSSVNEAKE